MTSELFKDEIDRLDSGLPDHPDTAAYMREGRAARRRRQGIVALGAGALVAAVVTPAVIWGGGTAPDGPTGDVAADTSVAASSPPVAQDPVDEAFGDGVTAAVTGTFPEARLTEKAIGDHFEDDGVGLAPAPSSPPDWANVFSWRQDYAIEGLQYFDVHSEWRRVAGEIRACAAVSFEVEKSCDTQDSGGGVVTVLHNGVHLQGEPDGDWARMVEVISPTSPSGATHVTQVWAQVQGMTWAEADAVLPPIGQLAMVANRDELVLPEPAEMPSRS